MPKLEIAPRPNKKRGRVAEPTVTSSVMSFDSLLEVTMPQPRRPYALTTASHPLCPSCLYPMHIRTASVTADGREKIQFVCGNCKAEAAREDTTDLFLSICDQPFNQAADIS